VNSTLASELGVQVGDRLLLRLPKSTEVPAESALGEKEDRIRTMVGLRVVAVIPDRSLGRFSLSASQAAPRNAYVALETIQDALDQQDRVNTLLVAGLEDSTRSPGSGDTQLSALLAPRLEDYGIQVQRVRRTFRAPDSETDEVIFDYFHITTNRMLLEPAAAQTLEQALADRGVQAVSTYVANSILALEQPESEAIPYSLVTGIDSQAGIGTAGRSTGPADSVGRWPDRAE
jgi:putative ABC transport system permease protein